MDSVTRVQILDETVCISLHTNALGKSMNLSVLPFSYGYIVQQTGIFTLGKATSLGERKP